MHEIQNLINPFVIISLEHRKKYGNSFAMMTNPTHHITDFVQQHKVIDSTDSDIYLSILLLIKLMN